MPKTVIQEKIESADKEELKRICEKAVWTIRELKAPVNMAAARQLANAWENDMDVIKNKNSGEYQIVPKKEKPAPPPEERPARAKATTKKKTTGMFAKSKLQD